MKRNEKVNVILIYGGKNAEHEVSIRSANAIFEQFDQNIYNVFRLLITKDQRWIYCHGKRQEDVTHNLIPFLQQFDVIFPILHGPNGEDGSLQGLLRFIDRPFVGSDVLATAICMDKSVTNHLLSHMDMTPYIVLKEPRASQIEGLRYPLFVKPANLGSSVGISRVEKKEDLQAAIDHAFEFDSKILVEEGVHGDEVECGVLGNDDPIVALPGRFRNAHQFYSYEAKYIEEETTQFEVPANYDEALIQEIKNKAKEVFQSLGCEGMARVDMFVTQDRRILINEVNTHPGFTSISLYPQVWEASGMPFPQLLDHLVKLGVMAWKKRSFKSQELNSKQKSHNPAHFGYALSFLGEEFA